MEIPLGGYGMTENFNNIYDGKKVFLTGHTGFKGSWLSLWLKTLGAEVIGYSLDPVTKPNHFKLLNLSMISIINDIRNKDNLINALKKHKPDIIFHLAAQPLVRYSYNHPHETFETNIMGTINIFEAARNTPSIRAIVNITSDKCYNNKEWMWGYRENDAIGGYDPYSASKGCSELITNSYQNSFFNKLDYKIKHNTLLASVRAGNVIGGGDWAEDRLIPDIIKATKKNEKVLIRSPHATRPWQHVLDPLNGYLLIGQKLLEESIEYAESWNFGPRDSDTLTVEQMVSKAKKHWNKIKYEIHKDTGNFHEAGHLKLDCSKAHLKLGWKSIWDSQETIEKTIEWYKQFYTHKETKSHENLKTFIDLLNKK